MEIKIMLHRYVNIDIKLCISLYAYESFSTMKPKRFIYKLQKTVEPVKFK